jgi:voltage-gated potassium channel
MKKEADSKDFRKRIFGALFALVFLIVVGSIVFHKIEGWGFVDSTYFTVITLTTIGYGDLFPTHATSKIFTMFFAFSGVGIFLYAMTIMGKHYLNYRVGVIETAVRRVGMKAIETFTPNTPQKPKTRRGFVNLMEIMDKDKRRARREEKLKKEEAKNKK